MNLGQPTYSYEGSGSSVRPGDIKGGISGPFNGKLQSSLPQNT